MNELVEVFEKSLFDSSILDIGIEVAELGIRMPYNRIGMYRMTLQA